MKKARMTYEEVAEVLNCKKDDIPILVAKRLLKPLGNPINNATKYFSRTAIEQFIEDEKWLSKVTDAIYMHSQAKNRRRKNNIVNFGKSQTNKGEMCFTG